MKRIAFFEPINLTPTGVPDYDDELLPLLKRDHDIDVFVERGKALDYIFPHNDFYFRHRSKPYDLILYQIGNSLAYEYIYGYLFQYPGAVVFRDCLHNSRARMLLQRGLVREYIEEVQFAHTGMPNLHWVAAKGLLTQALLYHFPLVRLPLRAALAAGAYSDFMVKELSTTETPVTKVPIGIRINHPDEGMQEEIKELYPGMLVIGSFGQVTPEKRLDTVFKALVELRKSHSNLRCVITGNLVDHYNIRAEIAHFKVEDLVQVIGRVDHRTFHLLMARSDIVVNLRYPSARETSNTMLKAMALAKPVLISRLQHLHEIPQDAVVAIRPDREQEDCLHFLSQLIENETLRRQYGNSARSYVRKHHRPEQMVKKYNELIELALRRKESYRTPEFPLHLQNSRQIMQEYIQRTSFAGRDSNLLDLALDWTDSFQR